MNSDAKAMMEEAAAAARRGDAAGMVRCLFTGRAVDGLVWKLSQQFHGSLAPEEVRDCVAEAIAECYAKLSSGQNVSNLVGYLLRTARNMAIDLAVLSKRHAPDEVDQLLDSSAPEEEAARESVRIALQREALERARALLPQLGQENIRRVMEIILDAIENEVTDLTDETIAEITDLKPETVRRLRNRGFERLTRLAQQQGLHVTVYRRAVRESDTASEWDGDRTGHVHVEEYENE